MDKRRLVGLASHLLVLCRWYHHWSSQPFATKNCHIGQVGQVGQGTIIYFLDAGGFYKNMFHDHVHSPWVFVCEIVALMSMFQMGWNTQRHTFPVGGFKYFLFSSLFGEDFQFWLIFSDGLKPPTRFIWGVLGAAFFLGFFFLAWW